MTTPILALTKMIEIRDQIHLLHWRTSSYAVHIALNKYYDNLLSLVDNFVETYQGKYGRFSGVFDISINSEIQPFEYLSKVMLFLNSDLESIVDPKLDTDLTNIIADMKQLTNQTLYLLSLS